MQKIIYHFTGQRSKNISSLHENISLFLSVLIFFTLSVLRFEILLSQCFLPVSDIYKCQNQCVSRITASQPLMRFPLYLYIPSLNILVLHCTYHIQSQPATTKSCFNYCMVNIKLTFS